LAARGATLENFVTSSLIQLLCRVTKFSWFDDDIFRELVKDSMNFLNQVTKDGFLHVSWACFRGNVGLLE